MNVDKVILDVTREQLISNILKYKIELIRRLSRGDFALHPSEVLAELEKCLECK